MKKKFKFNFSGIGKSIIPVVFLSLLWLSSCNGKNKTDNSSLANEIEENNGSADHAMDDGQSGNGKVIHMTNAMFLEKVYDYKTSPDAWEYKGTNPCIIDFYADWCRPCRMVAPIMDELAEKYAGKVTIYKVNTEKEPELARFFGIRSIPTFFFCPVGGNPQMAQGAMNKSDYEKIITDFLLKKQ
jgi:thioredoxin